MKFYNLVKPFYRLIKYIFLKIKCVFRCKDNNVNNFLRDKEGFSLFITHSLGGGTFQYEKNYLKDNSEKRILILRIFSYGKDLCYKIENKENGEELYISSKNIYKVFNTKLNEVIINSLIQIYRLFAFIDLLLEYKTKYPEIRYTYHVHDFHCVCPQQNLVAENWYCNLNCNKNNCKFDKFVYRYDGEINIYRKYWENFLLVNDEIICFSNSSKKILQTVYSDLDTNKITVKPHNMKYCNFTPLNTKSNDSIHVAFVGTCNTIPKGKLVIEKIMREISDDIKIFMIGSSAKYFSTKRKNIYWYGTYKHDDLPIILEELKIDKVIFPSVCPETFSYVISELMQMDIPIVSFDIGAQGEKLKSYDKGILCKDEDDMIEAINGVSK